MRKAKLYLNENLSWRIARALRGYGYDVDGYDVVSSHEIEWHYFYRKSPEITRYHS